MSRSSIWALMVAVVLGACSETQQLGLGAPVPLTAPSQPLLTYGGSAAPPVATAVFASSRARQSLSGNWMVHVDPDDVGVTARWYAPDITPDASWRPITVPGSLNHAFSDYFHYTGPAWYRRDFVADPALRQAGVLRLRSEGVFRVADVWLNGGYLGRFDRPYLPFEANVSGFLQPATNVIAMRVDNDITAATLPSTGILEEDRLGWWKYNGPIRDLLLEASTRVRVFRVHVTPRVDAAGERGRFAVEVGVWNEEREARDGTLSLVWSAPDGATFATKLAATFAPGASFFAAQSRGWHPAVWTPGTPQLHRLAVRVSGAGAADDVTVRFGLRTARVAHRQLLLNERPYYLLGVNRHEDHPAAGPTEPTAVVDADFGLLRDLGVNHLRTVHYPNRPSTYDRCDEVGLTAQEEIPLYQSPVESLLDVRLQSLAAQALNEMILRDWNHPSIILWSVGNENAHFQAAAAGDVIARLIAQAKSLDGSRPVIYVSNVVPALTQHIVWGVEHSDILAYNQYYGWFYNNIDGLTRFLDDVVATFPDRPVMISEWGAEAVPGRRLPTAIAPGTLVDEAPDAHSLSEDFQRHLIERTMAIYAQRPELVGQMPWVFADHYVHWEGVGLPLDYGANYPVPWQQLFGLYAYDRTPKLAAAAVSQGYRDLSVRLRERGVATYR